MKKTTKALCFLILASAGTLFAQAPKKPVAKPAASAVVTKPAASKFSPTATLLRSGTDSLSYAWGINIGNYMKNQGLGAIDTDLMHKGLNDVLRNPIAFMSPEQANNVISRYMQQMQAKKWESNRSAGEVFLAENRTKAGVTTLPSGLQYQVLLAGTGEKPKSTDRVKVHYHGTLVDGSVFDSSVQRGEPAVFGVTQVIQGWVEGLQLMPVGSKWKLFIPYQLAYGERDSGTIKPYSALIFDVELLEIEKQP